MLACLGKAVCIHDMYLGNDGYSHLHIAPGCFLYQFNDKCHSSTELPAAVSYTMSYMERCRSSGLFCLTVFHCRCLSVQQTRKPHTTRSSRQSKISTTMLASMSEMTILSHCMQNLAMSACDRPCMEDTESSNTEEARTDLVLVCDM